MNARRLLAVACCALGIAACAGPSAVQPPGPPPIAAPPPPPGARLPDGQWVYTQQYGWLWMPWDELYTYVPSGGAGEPLEFVFHANYGWTWVTAPWVWGYGPVPHWGRPGPSRFAWYQHGWWRTPQRWRYTAPPERGRVVGQPGRRVVAQPGFVPSHRPPQGRAQPARPSGQARGEGARPAPPAQGGGGEQGGGFTPQGAQR